jgi:hypothetical protein
MEQQTPEVVEVVAVPDLKIALITTEATEAQGLSLLDTLMHIPSLIRVVGLPFQQPRQKLVSKSRPLPLAQETFSSHESNLWTQLPCLLRRVRYGRG